MLSSPGELAVREVEDPSCPPGGLLIEVEACAVCPSDLKMAREGHRDLTYPRILGHEVVGRVVEAAPSLSFREGERVQVWPGLACEACPACRAGDDNMCPEQGILGFNRDGGFAQLMAVPAGTARRGVNRVPPHLAPPAASLTEPLACCVHAQHLCAVDRDDLVLITGAGPMGLLHLMLARSRGARAVVAEPDPARRRLAEELGAEATVDPGSEALAPAVVAGRGADVALLATPAADLDAVLRGMAPRGRVCLFSGLPRAQPPRADLNLVHYRELAVVGAYGCTSASDREALGLIASGAVAAERLITMETSLERVEEGFRHVERREGLKCVVTRFGR